MLTKTGGRWLTVNPKLCDYQSSIVLTLVNVTNTTIGIQAIVGSIQSEELELIYNFSVLCTCTL